MANGLPGHRYIVHYENCVDQKTFTGDLLNGGLFPYATAKWAANRISGHPLGGAAQVSYDPEDPGVSVLEPGWNVELRYPIASTLFLALSGFGLLAGGGWKLWVVVAGLVKEVLP